MLKHFQTMYSSYSEYPVLDKIIFLLAGKVMLEITDETVKAPYTVFVVEPS